MKLKVLILDIVLTLVNCFVKLFPIKKNKIAFVSLESKVLDNDFLLIYEELKKESYQLVCVLTNFQKNSLWMNFCYFLNTIKQLVVINTSALVILNDNNYVVSKYKRKEVKVLQVWHASGAIKKFGNAIKRTYLIENYDYIICNGDFWKEPYSLAFNVNQKSVLSVGMPRLDHLLDKNFLKNSKEKIYKKYPELKGKKVILYAPTFRGDIYTGMKKVDIDLNKLLSLLDKDYVILFKLHPLLKQESHITSNQIINMNDENLHELFTISDILISDFSSIIFDFSLLMKPIYAFVPDLNEYLEKRGCFVDFKELMGENIAYNETELANLINSNSHLDSSGIRKKYLSAVNGKGLKNTVKLIDNIINNCDLV